MLAFATSCSKDKECPEPDALVGRYHGRFNYNEYGAYEITHFTSSSESINIVRNSADLYQIDFNRITQTLVLYSLQHIGNKITASIDSETTSELIGQDIAGLNNLVLLSRKMITSVFFFNMNQLITNGMYPSMKTKRLKYH